MKKYVIIITVFITVMTVLLILGSNADIIADSDLFKKDTAETEETVDLGEYYFSKNYGGSITQMNTEEDAKLLEDLKPYKLAVDAKLSSKEKDTREANGITPENMAIVLKNSEGMFCYDNMDPELHQLYGEIYIVLNGMYPETPMCTVQEWQIDYVFNCVMQDHPEFFYVDGYSCNIKTVGTLISRISFTGKYTMDVQKVTEMNRLIKTTRKEFLKGISMNASDYEKVKYTYEYVILHTEYNTEAAENQNMCSVFAYGESVCQGYAKAFQYLSGILGVKSTVITGTVTNGEKHAWNLVCVDNAYYYVDATWGDSSYENENAYNQKYFGINYDYLCITTDEISRTHKIDNIITPPRCVETKANYFVMEDLYFTTVDRSKLKKVFRVAYTHNQSSISIKCSDSLSYQYMQNALITNQEVFDYLNLAGDTAIYATNDDQYTLTFQLR